MKRNKFAIIENVLTLAMKKHTKTRIMRNANLNYVQSIQYLEFLLQLELLKLENDKKRTYYKTTNKGFVVLNKIGELFNIVEPKVDGTGKELTEIKFSRFEQTFG